MDVLHAVAIDLGAESCRVSLGSWRDGRARLQLVTRFQNGAQTHAGQLVWDLQRIQEEVAKGLRACAALAPEGIASIGVDGWAVDYVRLGADSLPLAPPFCYRDPRTDHAMAQVWERLSRERIYALTGIQFLRFNTLYQLFADRRDGLPPGTGWLNLPEYLLAWLGGRRVAEFSNATHTQLVDVHTRGWADEIFAAAGLDRAAAPDIVPAGTVLGRLQGPLTAIPALAQAQLIAPCCHDTGAAVAGIPDPGQDWAFLSSGTWSLIGRVLERPCLTPSALANNFTHEGGVGGRLRFLKNVNGLWLLQECLRTWTAAGRAWTLPELLENCARLPPPRDLFFVDAEQLWLPGNMPERINRELQCRGASPLSTQPEDAPTMTQCILHSLAARYAEVLQALEDMTQPRLRRLYVVGGGSQNAYLNQLIAARTGLEVVRGAVESSTVGNLAVQFAALHGERGDYGVSPDAVARWARHFGSA